MVGVVVRCIGVARMVGLWNSFSLMMCSSLSVLEGAWCLLLSCPHHTKINCYYMDTSNNNIATQQQQQTGGG